MSKHTIDDVLKNPEIVMEIMAKDEAVPRLMVEICNMAPSSAMQESEDSEENSGNMLRILTLAALAAVMVDFIKTAAEEYTEDPRLDK